MAEAVTQRAPDPVKAPVMPEYAALRDKVVLVTGGGRGLGGAVCTSLSEAGARVVAADIQMELARRLSQQARAEGREIEAMELDVSDERQVDRAISAIIDRHGAIDIVINNAGIDLTVSIEDMPVREWQRIIDVNLSAAFILSRRVFPVMRKQGGGHIVNIVSTAAKRAWANASAYHASKWGLLGLSHAMHVEGRPHQIKVTAVISGGLRTPFLLDRFPEIDVSTLQDPKNVADTIRFLLCQPGETVIPEITVLPMRETSWP